MYISYTFFKYKFSGYSFSIGINPMITVADVTREGNYVTDIPELYHDKILMCFQCSLQLHFILDFV